MNEPHSIHPSVYSGLSTYREVSSLLENLDHKIHSLPKVDEQGQSECPFAEKLYAEKEESAQELCEALSRLKEELQRILHQIASVKHDLSSITSDAGLVQLDAVSQKYNEAEAEGWRRLKTLEEQKQILQELLQQGEALLSESKQRSWPGKEPPKSSGPQFPIPLDIVPIPGKGNPGSLPGSQNNNPQQKEVNWDGLMDLDQGERIPVTNASGKTGLP